MNIFERVSEDLHFHHAQETPVTTVTISTGTTETPAKPGVFATLVQAAHHDVTVMGRVVAHALPLLERIVTNQQLDQFVELALQAQGLGVGEEAFAAATAVLRDAMARHAATPVAPSAPTAPVPQDVGAVPSLAGENPSPVVAPDPAPENASASEHADGNGVPQEAEAKA